MKSRASISCAMSALLLMLVAPAAVHGGGSDVLKKALSGLGDWAGDALEAEVRALGEAVVDTARVESVDTSVRPSVVVHTADGSVFQLQTLAFVSLEWLDKVLERIERIDFEAVGGDEYRLKIVYVEKAGGGVLKKAVFGTAKRIVAARIGEEAIPLPGLVGTSLDGSPWFMVPSNHSLASIEFLHQGADI